MSALGSADALAWFAGIRIVTRLVADVPAEQGAFAKLPAAMVLVLAVGASVRGRKKSNRKGEKNP
jgi:hypothetical protein